MEHVYVDSYCLVHIGDHVQFFDDISALFEIQFSALRKVILDEFVCCKGILEYYYPLVHKSS